VVASGSPDGLKRELRGDAVQVELESELNGARSSGKHRAMPGAQPLPSGLERIAGLTEVIVDGRTLRARADDGARAVPAVLAALDAHGVAVSSVTVARPSLDDVYLRHAGRRFE
jgi:ABC-2 type transport system ATP-binding protein